MYPVCDTIPAARAAAAAAALLHPDDRRGMAQVRALLEQEGHVNGALKTTKKILEGVPPSLTGTLPGVSASEADKVGRNDLIKSRALK